MALTVEFKREGRLILTPEDEREVKDVLIRIHGDPVYAMKFTRELGQMRATVEECGLVDTAVHAFKTHLTAKGLAFIGLDGEAALRALSEDRHHEREMLVVMYGGGGGGGTP